MQPRATLLIYLHMPDTADHLFEISQRQFAEMEILEVELISGVPMAEMVHECYKHHMLTYGIASPLLGLASIPSA